MWYSFNRKVIKKISRWGVKNIMAAGAVLAAAIARAIKASGVIINVKPSEFQIILERAENPLIIHAKGGVFSTNYQYLINYKGFAFFTKSDSPISLPAGVEMIVAKKIWTPQ
jgi:hypothetical protein